MCDTSTMLLQRSLALLSEYCESVDYKGWDLFDGLNARMFRSTPFYRSRLLRLIWIQLFKRSPINFRGVTFVPAEYNAKGLALFISGLLHQERIAKAKILYKQLRNMACSGYSGVSWGYNFDWESRAFFVPHGKPNLVTTVFVANSFLDYFDITKDREALLLARDACDFILSDLPIFENKETLCFAYIPNVDVRVDNVNMLAAALLSRVFVLTKDTILLDKSRKAMAYSIKRLKKDYSWPYGELRHHQFVDNFHTGFNLDSLYDWMKNTGDYQWENQLECAYHYYLDNFWLEDGSPKYYNNSIYPIDIHCSAQGILTCLKLHELDTKSMFMAYKIAHWAIVNMQDKKGYFYCRKTKWGTNKIPYIRWSQAWMFHALSTLASYGETNLLFR